MFPTSSTTLSLSNATILPQDSSHTSDVSPHQSTNSTTPEDPQDSSPAPESGTASADSTSTQTQTPKPVFSLFLSPEQRKKKLETETAALTTTTNTLNKRGKKPKSKSPAPPANATTSTKPPIDPKTIVDPNISKDGETHPFFQEVKASKLSVSGSASNNSSKDTSGLNEKSNSKIFNSKPQESPFPLSHQQFHGSDTIDAINGVVARLCGLSATSEPLTIMRPTKDKKSFKRSPQSKCGWYNLRASPDLGISAPQYKLRNRGKDSWIYWGKDKDQKWRGWSERHQRLQRPNDKERKLLIQFADQPEEFDSCQRVAENQRFWQKNLESAILTSVGLAPGSADAPIDLKIGELWTDKYRPNCGADVLGNRANTEYLTQWLKGLEVSGWTLKSDESSTSGRTGNPALTKKTSDIMGTARKRRKRPKRGTSDIDDFIVYDDADDFEDPYGYMSEEEDELFGAFKPLSGFSRLAYREPVIEGDSDTNNRSKGLSKTFDIKSNAILLSGPTGSCKTAAVYACAEECGYEVFEVSPGSRRTGKEVLGFVGEMAENHHVHVVPGKSEHKDELQVGGKAYETIAAATPPASESVPSPLPAPAPKSSSTLHSFFSKTQYRSQGSEKDQQDEDVNMENSSDVDIEGDDEDQESSYSNGTPGVGTPSSPTASSTKEEDKLSDLYSLLTTTNPRQSLILLEEVDILFDDDKGFWASIVALLSKSKRPVVMTCNDTSKIPTGMLRFQEHLEFERPKFLELLQYLTLICKIEGYMCSSEYIMAVIKSHRHDVRSCLMQLQYDSGVVRNRPQWSGSSSHGSSGSPVSESPSNSPQGGGSPVRKKLQRLSRISVKRIVPVAAPLISSEVKSGSGPIQELEHLELQAQYAEDISLWDADLRMKPRRAIQCFESDQFEASRDDIVGQHFSIYKRPTGADHLLLDQECASLFQEGSESLYLHLASQQGLDHPFIYEENITTDDPVRAVAENFVPLNQHLA
ncbi:Sorting nexin mvp1, partial [Entomortierella beljakovae]